MEAIPKPGMWIVLLVIGYAMSSSLLAIANKMAVMVFPFPSVLLLFQYVTCVISVSVLGVVGVLKHESLNFATLKGFFGAAVLFYLALFTNTKLLLHANVDTFIVTRSSTPLFVAVVDSIFMRKPWPSKSTFLSLILILLGAVFYVSGDTGFSIKAYSWAFAYLLVITVDMVYIKHIVMTIGLSTWGLVLYNNFLAVLFSPVFFFASGELGEIQAWYNLPRGDLLPAITWLPIGICCLLALSISFFGFSCRKAVSATAFTVIGVTNKLLTVLINLLLLPHASFMGTCWLLVCIAGGVMYQQSTSVRKPSLPAPSSPRSPSKSSLSFKNDEETGSFSDHGGRAADPLLGEGEHKGDT